MQCLFRLALAAMHFNENSGRSQATDQFGNGAFAVKFPKAKHGGFTIRMVPRKSTYGT
jgi:hypothetical protein